MDHTQATQTDCRPRRPLRDGSLPTAISDRIVSMVCEHYGRCPTEAWTYLRDDLIIVVIRGWGFTPVERTFVAAQHDERVVAMRRDFHDVMAGRFTGAIEELSGGNVLAFLSQTCVGPDITVSVFILDGPLEPANACPCDSRPGPTGNRKD
jgi:uncharacterized protein YbcI